MYLKSLATRATVSGVMSWTLAFDLALPGQGAPRSRDQKKTAWPNTSGYSTTPAYSLMDPPGWPGWPSASHPTTSSEVSYGVI